MANRVGNIPLRVEYTDVNPREQKYATALQIIRNSFLDPSYQASWTVHSLRTVKNYKLYQFYQAKARELRQQDRDTTEHDMFTCYKTMDLIRNILENGLQTRQSSFNFLGDSKRGVNLCKHADIQLKAAENTGQEECYLIMYKVMLGKALPVLPSPDNSQLQPIEGYDSHISNMVVNRSSPLGQQAIRSQVFCYEYVNGQLSTCPRHVLPYVVVCYRRNRSSAIPPAPSMPSLSMQVPQQQQPPRSQIQPPPPPLVQMAPAPGLRHPGFFPARSENQPSIPNFQPRLPPKNPFLAQSIPMLQPFPGDPAMHMNRAMIASSVDTRPHHVPPALSTPGMPQISRAPFVIPPSIEPHIPQTRPGMRLPYITPSAELSCPKVAYNQPMSLPIRPPVSTTIATNATQSTDTPGYSHSFDMFSNSSRIPAKSTSNGMTIPLQMPSSSDPLQEADKRENNNVNIGMRLPIVIQPEEPETGVGNEHNVLTANQLSHMRLPTVIRNEAPEAEIQSSHVKEPSDQNMNRRVTHQPPIKVEQTTTNRKKPIVIEPIIIDEEEEIEDLPPMLSRASSISEPTAVDLVKNQDPVLDLSVKEPTNSRNERVDNVTTNSAPNSDDELVIDDQDSTLPVNLSNREIGTSCHDADDNLTAPADTGRSSAELATNRGTFAYDQTDNKKSPVIDVHSKKEVAQSNTNAQQSTEDESEDDTLPDLPYNNTPDDSVQNNVSHKIEDRFSLKEHEQKIPAESNNHDNNREDHTSNSKVKPPLKDAAIKAKKKRKRLQSPWLTTKPKKRKLNKAKPQMKKSKPPQMYSFAKPVFVENVFQENTVFRICKDGSISVFFDMYTEKSTAEISKAEYLQEVGPTRTLIEVEKDIPKMTDFLMDFEDEFSPFEIIHLGEDSPESVMEPKENGDHDFGIVHGQGVDHADELGDSLSDEPVSPPVDAYHDFSFEMPLSPRSIDHQVDVVESKSEVKDLSLDKVKEDHRYQPKVVVEDITATAVWDSYMNKAKEDEEDDVMNLKITCVQSLTSADHNDDMNVNADWNDHLENSDRKCVKDQNSSEAEELPKDPASIIGRKMELALSALDVGNDNENNDDSDMPDECAPVGDGGTGSKILINICNESKTDMSANDTKETMRSTTPTNKDLESLMNERTELWKTLKELDGTEEDESACEELQSFDPSSIEKMGTKLSILRDLDEERDKGKKRKCLAKLSEVKNTLKFKRSEQKDEKKDSALDLILDDSDISTCEESNSDDYSGRIDEHCSEMKPNGKHDDYSDSDDNNPRACKRHRVSESKHSRSSANSTSTKSEHNSETKQPVGGSTNEEPYTRRLRSHLRPNPESKQDMKKKRKFPKRRSHRRRRRNISLHKSEHNTHESSTEKKSHQRREMDPKVVSAECTNKSEDLHVIPELTETSDDQVQKKDNDDRSCQEPIAETKSIEAVTETVDDVCSQPARDSEKWAETCERIFKGDLQKEKEECLFDGYTKPTDAAEPCQDPTEWLNTLIRLNQKGKDGSPAMAAKSVKQNKRSAQPAIQAMAGTSGLDIQTSTARSSGDKSEVLPKQHEDKLHTEYMQDQISDTEMSKSSSVVESSQSTDVYVSHPKYPAMPPGMKIKRTSSTGNRTQTERRSQEEGSSSSGPNPQNLSKEEVSQLVSKVLQIFDPNKTKEQTKTEPTKKFVVPSTPSGSMTRESQLHGHVVAPRRNIPNDPRSRYPEPYKKHANSDKGKNVDPRQYTRNKGRPVQQTARPIPVHTVSRPAQPTNRPIPPQKAMIPIHQMPRHISAQQTVQGQDSYGAYRHPYPHPRTNPPAQQMNTPVGGSMGLFGATGALNIDAVETNTIKLLAFSAIQSAVEDNCHTQMNHDAKKLQSSRSPRVRTDSASSTSDSTILSPTPQTPSPLTSPSYVSPEVVNRDPRKYSQASSSCPGRDIKVKKPVLDASLAIEKDMSESRTNINRLWESTICTTTRLGKESILQRDMHEKLDMHKNAPLPMSKKASDETYDQRSVNAKDEPWNCIVYDIEVPHGTCYKKIDDYGKSKNDPRLKPRQLTLDGNEEHVGRRLTKHTSKIPLEYTNKPQIIKPTSQTTRTEKGSKVTDNREQKAEGTEHIHKSPDKPATCSVYKDKVTQVATNKVDANEDKSSSMRPKGQKAGSMWSSLLGNERLAVRPADESDISTEVVIGECDETTRNAMEKVWNLSNLEWATLNTEMLDILQDRVSQIDDAMIFNDPSKGLTADRRRKLIASENINGRVAKELRIENDMQQLYERINHLREKADIWQQTGTPEEKVTELRNQIKVLDVRYEKYFKDLEELNRFHKSSVLEVLPVMFRLPEEAGKFISVEGNMLFLISTLNETDCKKLFALREEIITQKTLIKASEAPYIDRQQAKLRLGWLHGERKEALCEICINLLSNKESVVQKLSTRIIWCRKGEQALRDTGSSDDLRNYIHQRIQNLESYLKVLRCVQRTENGVWMPCRMPSNRSADRKDARREQPHVGHHRRSIEAVTPDPFKSSFTKYHETEKACDFTFPDSILSRKIPGIDIKDSKTPVEDNPTTFKPASQCTNSGNVDPTKRVSTSKFDEKDNNDLTKIDDQQSMDQKEEKKKLPTPSVSLQPRVCAASFFDTDIDSSLVIDMHEDDHEKTNNTVGQTQHINKDDDVKLPFTISQHGDTPSDRENNSSSSVTKETANPKAVVTNVMLPTDGMNIHDSDGAVVEVSDTIIANRDLVKKDNTNLVESVTESARANDTKNEEPSVVPDDVVVQDSSKMSLCSSDSGKTEKDAKPLVPCAESGKETGNTTLASKSIRENVDEQVSKILALLKACQNECQASTRHDQYSAVDPKPDCSSTLNASSSSSYPTTSKQPPSAATTESDDPPNEGSCDNTNLHDMDISDISDSPGIEVCSPPSGTLFDSYRDVDWRPIIDTNRTSVGATDSKDMSVACEGQSRVRDEHIVEESHSILNNNNAQINSKEQCMVPNQNDMDMRMKNRPRSRWDVKPKEMTCRDPMTVEPETTNIVERRTITVDNTPWRAGNQSRSDHSTTQMNVAQSISKEGETRPTRTALEILAKANLFKKASDLVEHSVNSPQGMEIDSDACIELRSNQLQSRNLLSERHCDRIVTITKSRSVDKRECSPSSVTHSDRSCSIESDSRFDVDERSYSRSRSRSPPMSRRRKRHTHDAVQNRVLEQSTSNDWTSDRRGPQDRSYQQLSFNDPTIRRILSGDPVLIEMLSHPTSATRLASMLPNVQDRETVFKLAREVQNDVGQMSDDQR